MSLLNDEKFSPGEFKSPGSFYWPGYIWFWLCEIKPEDVRQMLADMNSVGAKSVWSLPVPADFRPNAMTTSLKPDFLTEEFAELMREYARTAEELDMKVWLYDDGGWPSGSACGRIVKENPGLAAESIGCVRMEPADTEIKPPRQCLLAVLHHPDGSTENFTRPGNVFLEDLRKKNPSRALTCYHVRKREPSDETYGAFPDLYPDLLNPGTANKFIELCHEFYKKHLPEHFGRTIPLIFLDESGVITPPWTDGLAESFRETYGYDIIEKLPHIFTAGDAEGMQVRIDYFDWWSRRLCGAFLAPLAEWCRKSGIMFAGHFGGDDETIGSRVHGYGHILRALRTLDIPGVDAIWRQIFPGKKQNVTINIPGNKPYDMAVCANHHFPKFASSVMRQRGLKWSVTESFAVYGEGLTLAQMRWIIHFQYVRGINLTTMGGTQYRAKGFDRVRQRPIFSPDNPSWDYMPLFHGYVARLSYLLSLGVPVVSTAVYFPVRDVWAGGPSLHEIIGENDKLAKALFELHCDYDFIDDDVLADAMAVMRGGCLCIGEMRYDTVYVSHNNCMKKESKDTLRRFAESGGRVIYVSEAENLRDTIRRTAVITPQDIPITVCKRRVGESELYFLVNEGMSDCACVLEVCSDKQAYLLDPGNGNVNVMDPQYATNGRWSIPLKFAFADAKMVLISPDNIMDGEVYRLPQEHAKMNLNNGWNAARVKSHEIGEETHKISECPGECAHIELGDWRHRFGEDFSGTVRYEISFNCSDHDAKTACRLDLGDVRYYCEAELNGMNLGKKAWPPYVFDIRGLLKPGKNTLAVRVTNTFANQFLHTHAFDNSTLRELSGYHYIAAAFEADSLPSGLFGPVTVS